MYRYAVVDPNNNVENIVLWDEASQWSPPENRRLVKIDGVLCNLGWKYENENFVDPVSLAPEPAGE